ncbi:MAG TPA: choice-of-anchor tandem repeat GloVer-containing protein [Candidatus Sulfotelmatobacter sp.]
MSRHQFCIVWKISVALLAALLSGGPLAVAQTEGTLHNFGSGTDGNTLYGGVTSDASGNLYGTTFNGGAHANGGTYGAGTVFELSPQANGSWSETILHSFGQTGDGTGPASGLVFDAAGNLYGTTEYGGGSTGCQGGCGIVYQLRPPAVKGGAWTESVLYRFEEQYRGDNPLGGVILDSAGNVYGTTVFGGGDDTGTVFELSPKKGEWSLRILYSFGSATSDGKYPYTSLTMDSSGNLYSTTSQGGAYNMGTVFELSLQPSGAWQETILHNFNPSSGDGSDPIAPLVLANGNLYGATTQGGAHNLGTIFEMKPAQAGTWTESVLYSFGASSSDGSDPWGGLVIDAAGDIFGLTNLGGGYQEGTAFKLSASNGAWSQHVLHSFGHGTDGKFPAGGLVLTPAGNIYGACIQGGVYYTVEDKGGTVFELRTK